MTRGFILISLLAVALPTLVALWVIGESSMWGGSVVVFAGGVNLLGGWLAWVPVFVVQHHAPAALPQGVLAATVIRLMVVGTATLAGMATGWWPVTPLAAWLVIFYLIVLVVETGWAVSLMARWEPTSPGHAGRGGSEPGAPRSNTEQVADEIAKWRPS